MLPLAYFLTWTTYGSWLPGDDRGWVRRRHGHQAPDAARRTAAAALLAEPPLVCGDVDRRVVEESIRRVCDRRGWHVHTIACRTNHVHVVVTAGSHSPEEVIRQLKSWASRDLSCRQRRVPRRTRWWSEGGSRRRVVSEADLAAVVAYVAECQDMPRDKASIHESRTTKA